MIKRILIGLLALMTALAATAADFTVERIDTSQFPLNFVYYRHLGADGENLGRIDLGASEVREGADMLRLHGEEYGESLPATLSIIIDSSGSMEGSMDGVLSAAHDLIGMLAETDEAEIIDFDTEVRRAAELTSDKDALRSALEPVRPEGATALYDAIALGVDDIEQREGLKAVVVLTDGKDERGQGKGRMSSRSLDELTVLLEKSSVPVYAVGLGEGIDRSVLETVAGTSGGGSYFAAETDAVGEIYQDIIAYLHTLHRFYYVSRNADRDGTERRVALRVRAEATDTRLTTSYVAPEGSYWSYSINPDPDDHVGNVEISPDGTTVWAPNLFRVISDNGRCLVVEDWRDAYGAQATNHYLSWWSHAEYGRLVTHDGERLDFLDAEQIIASVTSLSREGWNVKAISPADRYLLICHWDGDGRRYYYALVDFQSNEALWEQSLYQGEFQEPGAVAVADDGTAVIAQDDNLFLVQPDGTVSLSWLHSETGRRYDRLEIAGDGSLWAARLENQPERMLQVYDRSGELLWSVPGEQSEYEAEIAVSPNGRYIAVNDVWGVRIYDSTGAFIAEHANTEPLYGQEIKGVGVANDGSYAYAVGSRLFYDELE